MQILRDTRILQILHILFDHFPLRVRNLVSAFPNEVERFDECYRSMHMYNSYANLEYAMHVAAKFAYRLSRIFA